MAPRVLLDAPVLVDLFSRWERVHCRDVSATGISVELGAQDPGALELALGAEVEVYFELPSWVAIETAAVIVRTDSGVAALRFVDLAPESSRAIQTYCDDTERGGEATAVVRKLAIPGKVRLA